MDHGFLIVRDARRLLDRYAASAFALRNAGPLAGLRAAFPRIDPARYRGSSRDPLDPLPSLDPVELEVWRSGGWVDVDTDAPARMRFREIAGAIRADDDILPSAAAAREVRRLLEAPSSWEIVEIRRSAFEPGPATLGFDIGYWDGDHFSAIADTIVTPCWHPPDPADFRELEDRLAVLNGSLLFPAAAAAVEFRAWYLERPWAEKELEPGEIEVIQVDAVEP